MKIWTQEKELRLTELYSIYGARKCAELLGVSFQATRNKARRLKLKRERNLIQLPEGFKWCSKCKTSKPIPLFRQSKDRIWGVCKSCFLEQVNAYQIINKDKIRKYRNEWSRTNKNPHFLIAKNLRTRLYIALKGASKSAPTMKLIGCSLYQLKSHLESQFQNGMTWENYGRWHVDHIKPCADFDLEKSSEQYECFNFKNLQPLWARDNILKGKKPATITSPVLVETN
jgi:hypothetical protein